jgi:N-acetylmuramoyl-L-alanine amidase
MMRLFKLRSLAAKCTAVIGLSALLFYSAVPAAVTVKREGRDDGKLLQSIIIEKTAYISLNKFCEIAGFSCRWNKSSQKLTCVKDSRKAVFFDDIPFCFLNDSLRQLPCAPVYQDGALFLPAWITVSVLGAIEKEPMQWNDVDSIIVIGAAASGDEDQAPKVHAAKKDNPSGDDLDEKSAVRQPIKNIVIDPGHGGRDPGAIGPDGAKEKDIVLSVGLKLKDLLKKKNFRFI